MKTNGNSECILQSTRHFHFFPQIMIYFFFFFISLTLPTVSGLQAVQKPVRAITKKRKLQPAPTHTFVPKKPKPSREVTFKKGENLKFEVSRSSKWREVPFLRMHKNFRLTSKPEHLWFGTETQLHKSHTKREFRTINQFKSEVCAFCLEPNPTHVLHPCGHQCLCEKCGTENWPPKSFPGGYGGARCPICRDENVLFVKKAVTTNPNVIFLRVEETKEMRQQNLVSNGQIVKINGHRAVCEARSDTFSYTFQIGKPVIKQLGEFGCPHPLIDRGRAFEAWIWGKNKVKRVWDGGTVAQQIKHRNCFEQYQKQCAKVREDRERNFGCDYIKFRFLDGVVIRIV